MLAYIINIDKVSVYVDFAHILPMEGRNFGDRLTGSYTVPVVDLYEDVMFYVVWPDNSIPDDDNVHR